MEMNVELPFFADFMLPFGASPSDVMLRYFTSVVWQMKSLIWTELRMIAISALPWKL